MGKKIEHTFINGVEYKWCHMCKQWKPLSEFSKDKTKKDGLNAWCKECKKQHKSKWDGEHADERKQYRKQYYTNNREHMLERNKQYYVEHAEEIAVYNAERYATIEYYAYTVRQNNLKADRKYGRIAADEDPLAPLEYYIWALQQPDYYDGKQYHWSEMGLDRKDNSKPHTIDNVVPATTAHNRQRQKMPFKEFCELIKNEELGLVLS